MCLPQPSSFEQPSSSVATEEKSEIGPQLPPTQKDESTTDFIASIKRTAEEVAATTGFVYEPTSGLYYDYKTGYYYNSELGLYYDGTLGCYYTYDQETETFAFHSYAAQAEEPKNEEKPSHSKVDW